MLGRLGGDGHARGRTLPIVDDRGRLVGYLSRGDLLGAWRTRIEEERQREIVFRLRRRGPTSK